MDLDDLLEAARRDEDGALAAVANALYWPLRRYFRSRGVRDADVDDLTQRVLQTIVEQLPGREPRDSYSGWVWTIARNLMVDRHRGERGEARVRDQLEYVAGLPRTTPLTRMERDRVLDAAERAIEVMPTPMRKAVRVALDGGDPRELAAAEGIVVGTVRTRLFRGWAWLRDELDIGSEEK